MKKGRLFRQLYLFYMTIIVASLIAVILFSSNTLKNFYFEQTSRQLEEKARLMEKEFIARVESDPSSIDAICKELGKESGDRVTLILPSGLVIADSFENPSGMDNHGDRPEVIAAFSGVTGKSIRHSYTEKAPFFYVAIPLKKDGKIAAVLRLSLPLTSLEKTLRSIYVQFAIAGFLMLTFAALVSYAISRRMARPLNDLKVGAERFAVGDFNFKLISDAAETSPLAEAMNNMAGRLSESIGQMTKERNILEAILSSMVEGVFAVDNEQRVINMNRVAHRMLDVPPMKQARAIQEVIRNTEVQQFVKRTLAAHDATEGEISITGENDVFLQASGAPLRDALGASLGAVIVLNDITRLRKLEKVRRDFVANVSHELKTPITSIKGFVETLQADTVQTKEDAERFLTIIAKQADRLNSIIEDLLSLSRIEQESERNEIPLEKGMIGALLKDAISASENKALEKNIKIELNCEESIHALINYHLLEQAVINLLDNAIKYSDPGSIIRVTASYSNGETVISVSDQGCGIEKEHLPRLFERFYRVDKARSRKLGGTGLGLAIVKHIVIAHRGSVNVESAPGKGSVFSVRLPKA